MREDRSKRSIAARVMKWLLKQARHGFQGVTGSFE